VARHPETGEPILASIGRYGPYVQHGKVYANLGAGDDVLEIGGNRAIDLIVAKESGAGGFRRGAADPGRALGQDPESGANVTVKAGRFGPYVTDGSTNATLPKTVTQDAVTLDEALSLLQARREAGGGKKAKGRGGARKAAPAKAAAKKAPEKPKLPPKPRPRRRCPNLPGPRRREPRGRPRRAPPRSRPPARPAEARGAGVLM
jgi:DNA topoisomerase-1